MKQGCLSGVLVLAATLLALPATAAIYRSVDAEGNVTYTNQPDKNAEPVELKPLSVYDAPPPRRVTNSRQPDPQTTTYRSVKILSPQPEQTVRSNPGDVTVQAGTEPELDQRAGHRYQFFLDGQPMGEPGTQNTMTFRNVDRGEHRVSVAVVDSRGKPIAKSDAVRFFLHRQTIFNPARRPAN